jgi:hypothetical protein
MAGSRPGVRGPGRAGVFQPGAPGIKRTRANRAAHRSRRLNVTLPNPRVATAKFNPPKYSVEGNLTPHRRRWLSYGRARWTMAGPTASRPSPHARDSTPHGGGPATASRAAPGERVLGVRATKGAGRRIGVTRDGDRMDVMPFAREWRWSRARLPRKSSAARKTAVAGRRKRLPHFFTATP